MVAAGNSSYLWFSDEETQAGGSVIRVMSVKKSVRGKQILDLQRLSCILKGNHAEISKLKDILMKLFFHIWPLDYTLK